MDDAKWFEFSRVFTFVPDESPQSSVRYMPGKPYRVRAQCIEKALAAGAGRIVETPQGSKAHGQSAKSPEFRSPDKKAHGVTPASSNRAREGDGEERSIDGEGSEETGVSEPEDG